MSVEKTLSVRGQRYGDFTNHAAICQDLKDVMRRAGNPLIDSTCVAHEWARLSPVQKQALEVIADKIARILSGDPNYDDNWHDIQGYARLVEERLHLVASKPEPGELIAPPPCCKYPNPSPDVTRCLNCGTEYADGPG